jgi:hypothetical protein
MTRFNLAVAAFAMIVTAGITAIVGGNGNGCQAGANAEGISVVPALGAAPTNATLVMWSTTQAQLTAMGYSLSMKEESYPSDGTRPLHASLWLKRGEPTIRLTDSYPAESDTFRVDTVSFGGTLGYSEFWCSNRNSDLDFSVAASIYAAKLERAEVVAGIDRPTTNDDTVYAGVKGYSSCWMG